MLVEYTFPVVGDIFMPEHWPIAWDQYRVTWTVKDGKAEAVTVSVHTEDLSCLPVIQQKPHPNVAANIDIGPQPYQEEIISLLRTGCGLLGFFANAEIDFDRPTVSWEAETSEERSRLQMFSYKMEPGSPPPSLPIHFDLVARCFLSARQASDQEIPLSFMAKGRRDMRMGKYIDAFYSHFFFLETQFAPGLSDPKKVVARFKAASEISGSLVQVRKMAMEMRGRVKRIVELINLTDDALIEHLVSVRGKLHHHALPRKKGSWHPEKHNEFEAESLLLSYIAHIVSQQQTMPILFDERVDKKLEDGARKEGAEYIYLVEVEGGSDRNGLNGLPTLRIGLPNLSPSHRAIAAVEENLRREDSPYDHMAVRSYFIKSTDGSQILAHYQNHTFKSENI